MQIISRRASESLVIDGRVRVTVVEVGADEVTFEVAGPDGNIERTTLPCAKKGDETLATAEPELASC